MILRFKNLLCSWIRYALWATHHERFYVNCFKIIQLFLYPRCAHPEYPTKLQRSTGVSKDVAIILILLTLTSYADIHVKVLLNEFPMQEVNSFKIFSDKGIVIKSTKDQEKQTVFSSETEIMIKHGELHVNGKKLVVDEKNIVILPQSEYILINNKPYHGHIQLLSYKNNFCLINRVKLEDYVYSVLKTESWPSWPLEMQEVMAIACRSYAIFRLLQAKKNDQPYHIKSSNYHQTYSGVHETDILKEAVSHTAGIIISFEGKPALAMFDICCGGVVTANIKTLNHKDAPYLSRKKPCNFCKDLKVFSWNFEINKQELINALKNYFKNIKNIDEIKVIKKDGAGLVDKILIRDKHNRYYLEGKKLYSLFKEVKSYFFDVYKNGNQIKFSGRGFGHHIGLCQWGANEMIKAGYNSRDVLKFYYPGIKFVKLSQKIQK